MSFAKTQVDGDGLYIFLHGRFDNRIMIQ